MSDGELEALLAEQVDYYRARAREYDATSGFDRSARGALTTALRTFGPGGRVLELACGTGQWTEELAQTASQLTAVDASAEMLELNRARVGRPDVRYIQADLFAWSPDQRYDVVFFAAWLSHVPPQRFEDFWALVGEALDPDGRVFVIDELPAFEPNEERIAGAPAPAVRRQLSTGADYRAVKVFYEPGELGRRLAELGWAVQATAIDWHFFYASGARLCASARSE